MSRALIVTADDFGIGPATSRGILELAGLGVVTTTVLLVNSPHAADGVRQWRTAGATLELGWHPCLTLDSPIAPAECVPGLVDQSGAFLTLGGFLTRLAAGRVPGRQVVTEFRAQLARFRELTGRDPANVNAHHHLHALPVVGAALRQVLTEAKLKPFLRRVTESPRTLARVPGVRPKRLFLTSLGRLAAARQAREGFPGAAYTLGITDPDCVHADDFFARWLAEARGPRVELACHPGHLDATIQGRDGTLADGQLHRRSREFELLARPEFRAAVARAGLTLMPAGGHLAGNQKMPEQPLPPAPSPTRRGGAPGPSFQAEASV